MVWCKVLNFEFLDVSFLLSGLTVFVFTIPSFLYFLHNSKLSFVPRNVFSFSWLSQWQLRHYQLFQNCTTSSPFVSQVGTVENNLNFLMVLSKRATLFFHVQKQFDCVTILDYKLVFQTANSFLENVVYLHFVNLNYIFIYFSHHFALLHFADIF